MQHKDKKVLNKEVGIATAIGAGLGLAHGLKNDKILSSALLGAGVGVLVGIFGQSLFEEKPNNENVQPSALDNQQD